MVVMSEDYGADSRLVAFMQYLRVAVVTAMATLVAHAWTESPDTAVHSLPWFTVLHTHDFYIALAVSLAGAVGALALGIPGGSLLVPLALGIGMQNFAGVSLELPLALLSLAYAVIGWSIGLRFTRSILSHALRVFPQVLGAIFALIALGALMAVALHRWVDMEPLTAYLATSPGGADSVAVIAATSAVDAGFVMAMQMVRFTMVLVLGPQVSKLLARHAHPRR
jgi:membrane AbrB-like protein